MPPTAAVNKPKVQQQIAAMPADIKQQLLDPGFGGQLEVYEALYIQDRLQRDGRLRKRWGIKGQGRVPLTTIAAKAWPEDPKEARRLMEAKMQVARRDGVLGRGKQ